MTAETALDIPDATKSGKTRRERMDDRLSAIDLDRAEPGAALPEPAEADRKAFYDEIGKELARIHGADALAEMIALAGAPSQRELERLTGYKHSKLSRIVRGDSASGPYLWTLFAMARALDLRLELRVSQPE